MSGWSRCPTAYQINTWVWLSELSLKSGTSVDLGSVPSAEWDAIAKFGFDAVWFMGYGNEVLSAAQLPIRTKPSRISLCEGCLSKSFIESERERSELTVRPSTENGD